MSDNVQAIPLNAERFANGLRFKQFKETMDVNERRIQQMYDRYELTDEDKATFAELVKQHGGKIYITALIEDWCPDVILNLPVAKHLENNVDGIELRCFVRSDNPDLQEAYAAQGIERIPTFSFFDSDWNLIGTFVERSDVAHEKADAWEAEHGQDLDQWRANQDAEKLEAYFAKKFVEMIKWYRGGLWRETLSAFDSILSA